MIQRSKKVMCKEVHNALERSKEALCHVQQKEEKLDKEKQLRLNGKEVIETNNLIRRTTQSIGLKIKIATAKALWKLSS